MLCFGGACAPGFHHFEVMLTEVVTLWSIVRDIPHNRMICDALQHTLLLSLQDRMWCNKHEALLAVAQVRKIKLRVRGLCHHIRRYEAHLAQVLNN